MHAYTHARSAEAASAPELAYWSFSPSPANPSPPQSEHAFMWIPRGIYIYSSLGYAAMQVYIAR